MMVCIRRCNKCGINHIVGAPCPKPTSVQQRREETKEFFRKLTSAKKASKNSTLRFGEPHQPAEEQGDKK